MQRYLAFDLGAESGRAVAGKFDGGRLALEEVHRFWNKPVVLRGVLHWDFPGLFREMCDGLVKFVRDFDQAPAGISCDSWGVDFGLLDPRGSLLGNPVHYRDKRTQGMSACVFSRVSKEEIYSRTGIQYMPLNTLFQLEALHSTDDPQWAATDKFLLIADLVHYFLCGAEVVESSLASTTHLYDARERTWSKDLIDRLGFPYSRFPEIVPSGTRIGTLDEDLAEGIGLPVQHRNSPVIASLSHDTAAAVAAVPADPSTSWAYLSSGTWSLLGVELPEPILTEEALNSNFTNEGGAENTVRFLKNIMGLWVLQECRRTWEKQGSSLDYSAIAQRAHEAVPRLAFIDPDDPRFLPPGDMPSRVQSFCRETGQPVPEGPGPIARCIFESLALKYRYVLERMEALTGRRIEVLHIVGGGGKNRFLNQMVADATRLPVWVGPTEATALGNIISQASALNEVGGLWEGRRIIARCFEPERFLPLGEDWSSACETFRHLVER
jgi:sugar (pentulose or hexulose) kinase